MLPSLPSFGSPTARDDDTEQVLHTPPPPSPSNETTPGQTSLLAGRVAHLALGGDMTKLTATDTAMSPPRFQVGRPLVALEGTLRPMPRYPGMLGLNMNAQLPPSQRGVLQRCGFHNHEEEEHRSLGELTPVRTPVATPPNPNILIYTMESRKKPRTFDDRTSVRSGGLALPSIEPGVFVARPRLGKRRPPPPFPGHAGSINDEINGDDNNDEPFGILRRPILPLASDHQHQPPSNHDTYPIVRHGAIDEAQNAALAPRSYDFHRSDDLIINGVSVPMSRVAMVREDRVRKLKSMFPSLERTESDDELFQHHRIPKGVANLKMRTFHRDRSNPVV